MARSRLPPPATSTPPAITTPPSKRGARDFFKTVLANLTAGLLLASALFLINDTIFVPQEVNGLWNCSLTVEETNHAPYKGMITGHVVVVQSDGKNVMGTVERVWEEVPPNPRVQYPQERILHGTIEGYHETRLVFLRGRDRMQLVVQLRSGTRSPTYYLSTDKLGKESLIGKYAATVALGEKGSFECER